MILWCNFMSDNRSTSNLICKHEFLELCIYDHFHNHTIERKGGGEEKRWLTSEWRQQQNWNTMKITSPNASFPPPPPPCVASCATTPLAPSLRLLLRQISTHNRRLTSVSQNGLNKKSGHLRPKFARISNISVPQLRLFLAQRLRYLTLMTDREMLGFYWSSWFITGLTKVSNFTLSWYSSIKFTSSHPISLRSIIISPSHMVSRIVSSLHVCKENVLISQFSCVIHTPAMYFIGLHHITWNKNYFIHNNCA